MNFPGCGQLQPPRLGKIEVSVDQGTRWTEGHAGWLVIAANGADACAAALNQRDILLFPRHLQNPNSGLRVIGVENTGFEG
jgi:hypothetical protein